MKTKETKKLPIKELIWYIIAGFIAFGGLIFLVFGLIGHFMPVAVEDNFVKQAEKNIVLNFTWWGLIIIAVAAVLAIIVLLVFAKQADRETEKTIRRQQRLASSKAIDDMEIKPAVEEIPVEAMVKPATEEKPVEEPKKPE